MGLLSSPPNTGTLMRIPLPVLDWTEVLQQRHRYRSWVWRRPGLNVAGIARQVAVEAVADWRLSPMADDVALCVGELMGNALTHGQSGGWPLPVSLGLRYFPTCCLFVEVGDTSTAAPLLTAPGRDSDPAEALLMDGRGLMIVQRIADHLWWRQLSGLGKTVYARLDTPRYFEPLTGGGDCG
ncbi:ATP-binding protein [Streptacidiphilus fuscans]|uniref:ATP-binding protein n=1 Tax=Streptacidiphilus fuscans TaxID=2789292 RepID=A0A931FE89_9ACTN|nr:ATP-binding protein [Streptacidiphilus fuscans]MBF9071492.1 ATP-binding protein [Streptacidiphilus fuscans]